MSWRYIHLLSLDSEGGAATVPVDFTPCSFGIISHPQGCSAQAAGNLLLLILLLLISSSVLDYLWQVYPSGYSKSFAFATVNL